MSGRRLTHSIILSAAALIAAGCGGSQSVAEHIRPKDMTASKAKGDPQADAVCHTVGDEGEPLVVDWSPEQRGDLEVAMADGVAVVSYDCKKLRILKDCRIEGTYGFKGVILKQQLIRLEDGDEIRANLPLSGAALVAKLEGELERGATLDLALAMVGKRMSTVREVDKDDLVGRCEGATHFVRGASVGAFVMQSGSKAKVMSAAEVFGAGASAGSGSTKVSRNEDGSIEACKRASIEAGKPPENCGALIRLQLVAIDKGDGKGSDHHVNVAVKGDDKAKIKEKDELAVSCPAGLIWSDGKCTKAALATKHVCKSEDLKDCTEQCGNDDGMSCKRLGAMYQFGRGGARVDLAKAVNFYNKGCDLDEPSSCSDLGVMYGKGMGVSADDLRSAELYKRACDRGFALGCFNLGTKYRDGKGLKKDDLKAFSLFKQACDGGNPQGCSDLGFMYERAITVEKDETNAVMLYKRACEGGSALACSNVGVMYVNGKGVDIDPATGAKYYERACRREHMRACAYLGSLYRKGNGVAQNEEKGEKLLSLACDARDDWACREMDRIKKQKLNAAVNTNDAPAPPPPPPPPSKKR